MRGMDRALFVRAEAYMAACTDGGVHDEMHVRRVLGYALSIAGEMPEADGEIVALAALLHDVGRPEERADPTLCHAEVSSQKALDFLLEEGYPPARARWVADCVLCHRYRADRRPETVEAKILFDADKLDQTGALGAARVIRFGGQIGEPLYQVGERGHPLPGEEGEGPSLLREYRRKLKGLAGQFYTPAAQALARARQPVMDCYFAALAAEAEEGWAAAQRALAQLLGEE